MASRETQVDWVIKYLHYANIQPVYETVELVRQYFFEGGLEKELISMEYKVSIPGTKSAPLAEVFKGIVNGHNQIGWDKF
jgi:hypothetical protein